MIQVVDLQKSFSDQLLFKDVTFTLSKGERVGLVGRNGSGKSTLFKIILREENPDQGEIIFPKNYSVGALKQHYHFTYPTLLEECASNLTGENAEFELYKVEKTLMGLGFKASDFNRSPQEFSGGFQIRLNLAKLLISEPDCLLLDEPTNYLDIVSIRWLVQFLKGFKGEVILVTHDRGFMDEVTTHTMGLWRNKLTKIPGNSEKYFQQLTQEEEIYEKTRLNSQRRIKELEDFVERFKAKASKATQAQSRLKLIEKMPRMEALSLIQTLNFEFNFQECPGKTLIEVKDLGHAYHDQYLFQNLNFTIQKNDKIAIIGKNGKGKSTLLNLLAAEMNPVSGLRSVNSNLLIGHFGQTNIQRLDPERTIEEEILSVNPFIGLARARAIAATMMFSGELSQKKIKVLSGGERSRVLLGKLLVKPTNLLLLDEPTNHLDLESIEALTLELQNYPGAVVIVTHSEQMIRNLAEKLIIFHHDRVDVLNENYDDFLIKVGWEEELVTESAIPKEKPSRQDYKRQRSEIIVERGRRLNPLKKEIEGLEKMIMKLESEQKVLEESLIDFAAKGDSVKIQDHSVRLAKIKQSVEIAFDELTHKSLSHDEIHQEYEVMLKKLDDPFKG